MFWEYIAHRGMRSRRSCTILKPRRVVSAVIICGISNSIGSVNELPELNYYTIFVFVASVSTLVNTCDVLTIIKWNRTTAT